MTCSCCNWWVRSKVISRGSGANSLYVRKCIASGKEVKSNSEKCRYFNPTYFYCDKYNCRLTFAQCLQRRRNDKKFNDWDECRNCRQFDKEIRPILEKYYLDRVPVVTPRKLRDYDKKKETPKKRVIKRRNKPDSKKPRTITRRSKSVSNKPRKIKRRSKSEPRKIKRRG
jgi:hypothetical protein